MTIEQLNQARAEAWHQTSNPLLTADDAAAWLRETGVALFLPRTQQLATAAPSFVEAVLGAAEATPSREAIETATRLLERLLAAGDAIALSLTGSAGDQPDFLVTAETLPFVFALVGDKEWKRGPRGKSSPLVIEVWKLLDRAGPLTTIEVKEQLGRQLTEAAALRALADLWAHLRIEPLWKEGEPARWQLLERSRLKQMEAGSKMSQAVALSALVSLYLQSAVAASSDEIEVFLSPLASRSKVRDVVRGLTATRQLTALNLGPVEMFHVEGSLPEFAEIDRTEGAVVVAEEESGEIGEGRRRFVAKRLAAEADTPAREVPSPDRPRESARSRPSEGTRSAASRPGWKPADVGRPSKGLDADRRPFAPRPGTTGERKPYGTRGPGGKSSFNPREPWKEDRQPPATRTPEQARRPFARSKEDSGAASERRPLTPREGAPARQTGAPSERRPFSPRGGDRPFKPRAGGKSFGDKKPYAAREEGARNAYTPRAGGERTPFLPRDEAGGERKTFDSRAAGPGARPFKPGPGGKPFNARNSGPGGKPFGDRKKTSGAKPFGKTTGFSGERRPFAPRAGGTGKPFAPREGGDRRPSSPHEGGRGDRKPSAPHNPPHKPYGGDRPFKPRAGAKPFGERKPFVPREGSGERKPFAPREGSGERKPFVPREGSGERKPFAPRRGNKPFASRGADRPFKPQAGSRPSGEGKGRPTSAGRSAGSPAKPGGTRKMTGTTRARTSPVTSSGKPRTGVRPPTGRPGPRATRSGAAGARPGFKRPGRPGDKGRSK